MRDEVKQEASAASTLLSIHCPGFVPGLAAGFFFSGLETPMLIARI
jgi:hypothetical protein